MRNDYPDKGMWVSIHAPVWGATGASRLGCRLLRFNPRPRMGGDDGGNILPYLKAGFNPRPRMGGDFIKLVLSVYLFSFNPRPRMGGDVLHCAKGAAIIVSIHAPVWGAT